MPAKLVGTAKGRLIQSVGANISDQNGGIGAPGTGQAKALASGSLVPTTTPAGAARTSIGAPASVTDQAKQVIKSATDTATKLANPGMVSNGVTSTALPLSGVASAVGDTSQTQKDFDAERNAAVDEYGTAIGGTAENAAALAAARKDYEGSLAGGKTLEEGLNELRTQKGVSDIEGRLTNVNNMMRQTNEGIRSGQELNPAGSGGITQSALEGLRSSSTRDLIRNLSYLSNIQANTVDELNVANKSIDTLLSLRQTDRQNKQSDLKNRIDLLSSSVTPDQKEYLKAKLEAKLASVNNQEQQEADRIKTANSYKIQRQYTVGDANSADPAIRRIAIENAVKGVTSKYANYPGFIQRGDTQISDDIEKGIASGQYRDLNDAIQQSLVNPITQKEGYKDILAKTTGTTDKYELKPIQSTDDNGNLITTGYLAVNRNDPTDTKVLDANGRATGGSSGGYETASGVKTTGSTDLSSLYTGSNGPAFANNNPGNIKDTGFGGTANGQGGFTKFATVEDGINALVQKIKNAQTGKSTVYDPNMTIQQFFAKYAPASDNNNPNAYAKMVASFVGSNPNAKIKDIDGEQMAIAIMKHENVGVYKELIKRGLIGAEGVMTGTPAAAQIAGAPAETTANASFDPDKAAIYENALKGVLPKDIKTFASKNGKALVEEAKAWKAAQKTSDLSQMAQDVLSGKQTLGKLSTETRAQIQKELSDKGALNEKTGNDQFLNLDASGKEEILNLKNTSDLIQKVREIRERTKWGGNDYVGPLDNLVAEWFQKIGLSTKDFNQMQQILQKQINQLLKERSGAAVSQSEFDRLMKEIPTMSMGGKQFDSALENFENQLKSTMNNKARSFGFWTSNDLINRAAWKAAYSKYF